MTAFAAIAGADAADPFAIDRVASVLTSVYRSQPITRYFDGCVLLAAPLAAHDRALNDLAVQDDEAIVVDARTGVAAAGQVMLEGRASLATRLGLESSATGLAVCAAALDRWTPAFTERINGEFAVVLWDARCGSLVAARDGLGVRQLFAARAGGTTVVSNIAAAILAHPSIPPDLDAASIAWYLAHGSLAPGRTAFEAVSPVPAGHTLQITGRGAALRRHWTFPETRRRVERTPEETLGAYRDVLEQAAADRLTRTRASILLSGGIDSTTIAAAARRVAPAVDLRAFTADYARVPADSELPLARLAAGALGIPLTAVPGDAFPPLHYVNGRALPPQPMDEPALSDWRRLIGAAATHAPVVLYGEDGDSLFLPPGFAAMRQTMGLGEVVAGAASFAFRHRRLPYLGLRLRERLQLTPSRQANTSMPPWLTETARTLAHTSLPADILGQPPVASPVHPTRARTAARLQTGVADYLAALIAPDVTRERVELRCPMLDSRVIAFVVSVPPIPWCQDKFLPRQAYRELLPAAIYQRPKRGIAGLDEALVRAWLDDRPAAEAVLPPPLDEWIDGTAWRAALGQPASTAEAWRVLQLAAWISARRTATPEVPGRV